MGIGTDLTLSFSRGQDAGSFIGAVCERWEGRRDG